MDLNIRHVPDELAKRLKVRAGSEGRTLRDYAIGALEASLSAKNETTCPDPTASEPEPTVTCPICGLNGPIVPFGVNLRCWHCGSGFMKPEEA